MVLYDNQKRLLAISEEMLKLLGYESIEAFDKEDISELFIKKPGFIYDFSEFNWIDYVVINNFKPHHVIIKTPLSELEAKIDIKKLLSPTQEDYFLVDLKPVNQMQNQELMQPTPAITDGSSEYENDFEPQEIAQPEQIGIVQESSENTFETEENIFAKESNEDIFNQEVVEEQKMFESSEQNISQEQNIIEEENIFKTEDSFENSDIFQTADTHQTSANYEEPILKEESLNEINSLNSQTTESFENDDIFQTANTYQTSSNYEEPIIEDERVNEINSNSQTIDSFENEDIFQTANSYQTLTNEETISKEEPLIEVDSSSKTIDSDESFILSNSASFESESTVVSDENSFENEFNSEINFDEASYELGLSIDELKEIIKEYIENTISKKEQIFQEVEENNQESISRILHDLTGSAKNLRLEPLVEILTASISNREKFKLFFDKIDELKEQFFAKEDSLKDDEIVNIEDNIDILEHSEPQKEQDSDIFFENAEDISNFTDDTTISNESEKDDVINEEIEKILKKAQKSLGIDKEIYKDYVKELLYEIEEKLPILEEKDRKMFKSMARNLYLTDLANLIAENNVKEIESLIANYKKSMELI